MRSLDEARVAWNEVRQSKTLKELKEAVRLDGDVSIATIGGRSACWKVFLLFETLDTSTWIRTLSSARSAYNSLKSHFLRHIENPDELTSGNDPLSGEIELSHDKSSPWTEFRKDEELRGEILQDVVRCMPENLYFRQPDTQRALTDILFVFCKLNPDVGYRQGMHELLAPILWAVERDAIDLGQGSKAMGEDAVIKAMFDADHVEHDTFALFGQVMQSAKVFYEQTTSDGRENPMVARSRRIFSELLPLVDEKLAKHLEHIDIIPQVFLIRWIRLLFGREFGFDDMLTMWDVIFAEDPSLEVVDHICVAMLLRIHWDLFDADYNVALTLLLRYPEPGGQLPAQTFALDGLYLREHMDHHSGSYLVSKYTGRPLEQAGRPVTPPALQRNITTMAITTAARASAGSPTRSLGATRNLENVLSSTARNIYARGEKLGINKAVRSAVDEVQRKAQEIRDAQTPATPPSYRQRGGSRTSLGSEASAGRIRALETRSRQLAKLLEGAVAELWEFQRTASEPTAKDEQAATTSLERLSVAIAKVQFIQVYLDDPAMPLPEETEQAEVRHDATADLKATQSIRPSLDEKDTAPNQNMSTEDSLETVTAVETAQHTAGPPLIAQEPSSEMVGRDAVSPVASPPRIVLQAQAAESGEHHLHAPAGPEQPVAESSLHPNTRPRLEQSSLSWMLDPQETPARQQFASAATYSSEHGKGQTSLFGGRREESPATGRDARRASSESKQRGIHANVPKDGHREDDGVFDLGSLRHSRGKKG